MSDAELSRDLALALGYYPESVRVDTDKHGKYPSVCKVYRHQELLGKYWRPFDYRSPDVVVPLLKWLIVEHWAMIWYSPCRICLMIPTDDREGPLDICAKTLEEAVARAVIAVGRK